MRVSALFALARFPLNDGARHTIEYAHATGTQDGILVYDGNKKSSSSQGDQETSPCPEFSPEPFVSMGLITILASFLPCCPPIPLLRGDRDFCVRIKPQILDLCLWGFKLF